MCVCAHAHILLVPKTTTGAKEPGEGLSWGLTARFSRSWVPSAQVKGRWVDTGVRQEAIRGHHRLLAAAKTEGEEKGKALCAPLFSPALLMFVGSFVIGRMMVVANRVFK